MIKEFFSALLLAIMTMMASAQQLYVNIKTGNDANPGTRSQPLKTLNEGARRINANNQEQAATILLSEGVYPLTETVLFSNNKYTLENKSYIKSVNDVINQRKCITISRVDSANFACGLYILQSN